VEGVRRVEDKTRALRVNLSRTSARVRFANSSDGFGFEEVGMGLRGRRMGTIVVLSVKVGLMGEGGVFMDQLI
jgi:hypothetical protein